VGEISRRASLAESRIPVTVLAWLTTNQNARADLRILAHTMVPEKGSHARAAQMARRARDSAGGARRPQVRAVQDLLARVRLAQVRPEQLKPERAKPAQVKPALVKPAQAKPERVRPALAMGNLPRAGEIPAVGRRQEQAPVQARPERVKPVQVRRAPAKQPRLEQANLVPAQAPVQVRPVQAKRANPVQARPGRMRVARAEALAARQVQGLDRLNV